MRLLALLLLATALQAADTPPAIPLWPAGAPGSEARKDEAEKQEGSNVVNVHNPSITPFIPTKDATGVAVLIAPGGGHSKLCLGHEGYALAEWFQEHGVAAFVLKYRLAREKGSTYTIQDHAMADTRRALRLIRSRAKEWNIRPDRVGVMGFSAGGELAAFAAMKNDPGKPDAKAHALTSRRSSTPAPPASSPLKRACRRSSSPVVTVTAPTSPKAWPPSTSNTKRLA
jgi:endo-1,4-beta-xylanase